MENRMIKRYRWEMVLLFICLFTFDVVYAQGQYPVSGNRLFHIERSKNRNLVCYDANLEDGKLLLKSPLEIYWLNREENPGQMKGLSAIQRKMAYGYKVISRGDDSCEITLTAYSGKVLTIQKKNDKYVCTVDIDGKPAILEKLYVKASDKNSLTVEYIELFGVTQDTHISVTERVNNKEK